MRYVALMTGSGDGCDYTIGCNKNFLVFEATDHADAVRKCKRVWEDHGGSGGEPRVEEIELFVVGEEVDVPVGMWNEDEEERRARERDEMEMRKAEERLEELKKKLGKEPGVVGSSGKSGMYGKH